MSHSTECETLCEQKQGMWRHVEYNSLTDATNREGIIKSFWTCDKIEYLNTNLRHWRNTTN